MNVHRASRLAVGGLRHIVLAFGALVVLFPFLWMLSTSFKPPNEIYTTEIQLLPQQWIVGNYIQAFTAQPLLRYLINGVIVTMGIFLFQLLFSVPCAFALAKLRFRGREFLFNLVILGLLIPIYAVAIPLYYMLFKAGLLDSYGGLIVPFWFSAFGIFLLRQFFKTVPDDLIDAARLDGMSEFGLVWRIMLPVSLPALLSFGVFSVVYHWNDFFWPLIVVNKGEIATPPLGILFFRNAEAGNDVGAMMAAAVVVVAPLVIAFLMAQRRFIEGITMGSYK
jgi:multiple sugar transport system permease protein